MATRADVERALLGTLNGTEIVRALVILSSVPDDQLKGKTTEEAVAVILDKMTNGRAGSRATALPSWWRPEYLDMPLGKIAEDLAERRASGDPDVPSMPPKNRINSVRYRLRQKTQKTGR